MNTCKHHSQNGIKKKPEEIRFEKEAKALQKNLEKRKKQQKERETLKEKKTKTDGQD